MFGADVVGQPKPRANDAQCTDNPDGFVANRRRHTAQSAPRSCHVPPCNPQAAAVHRRTDRGAFERDVTDPAYDRIAGVSLDVREVSAVAWVHGWTDTSILACARRCFVIAGRARNSSWLSLSARAPICISRGPARYTLSSPRTTNSVCSKKARNDLRIHRINHR